MEVIDSKEFIKFMGVLGRSVKFAPKEDDLLETGKVWYAILSKEFPAEEIRLGFQNACRTFKDWPSLSEFRDAIMGGGNPDTEVEAITTAVMDALAKGGDPASSLWVKNQCGEIGYKAMGEHWGWYDIMSGNKRPPKRKEVEQTVRSLLNTRNKTNLEQKRLLMEAKAPAGYLND